MATREKIREGIENRLKSLMVLCGEPPQKAMRDARELVGAWFEWMSSQGVMIKVAVELNELEKLEYIDVHIGGKKVRYVKVEPLIEVKDA